MACGNSSSRPKRDCLINKKGKDPPGSLSPDAIKKDNVWVSD